ncbi:hypothetical protein GCM10022221_76640 [Actinocorallia aurea]
MSARCRKCKNPLSRDNRTELCGPCTVAARTTPSPIRLGRGFWTRPDIRAALAAQDWRSVLIEVQAGTGASQAAIAEAAGVSQAQISRLCNGRRTDPTYHHIMTILTRLGMNPPFQATADISDLAPVDRAGASPSGPLDKAIQNPLDPPRPERHPFAEEVRELTLSPADPDVIAGLHAILTAYIRADAMLGPALLLEAASAHLATVEQVCARTRGADRTAALLLATEWIEFVGWLHQDTGDFARAAALTSRALDCALQLQDPRVTAYVLMRKSAIATDAGDARTGLGLADAALAMSGDLTPRLRAVILRQRLRTLHAVADRDAERAADRDAERALAEAEAGDGQSEDDRAGYCTPAYIKMEIGASLLAAGRPQAALPLLESHRSHGFDPAQARDHALGLARLATAQAATGSPDQAHRTAAEALRAAVPITSARLAAQLTALTAAFTPHHHPSPPPFPS